MLWLSGIYLHGRGDVSQRSSIIQLGGGVTEQQARFDWVGLPADVQPRYDRKRR